MWILTTLYQNHTALLVETLILEPILKRFHGEWSIGGEAGQWVKEATWLVEVYKEVCMLIWGSRSMALSKFLKALRSYFRLFGAVSS